MMSRLMLNLRDPRMLDPYTRVGRTTESVVETNLAVITSVFVKDDQPERETDIPLHGKVDSSTILRTELMIYYL